MPDKTNQGLNSITETLTKMSEGIQQHRNDDSFPQSFKEEMLREIKSNLDRLNLSYSQAQSKAKQEQQQLKAEQKRAKQALSSYRKMLYGFYGTKNATVNDFGIQTYKDPIRYRSPKRAAPCS